MSSEAILRSVAENLSPQQILSKIVAFVKANFTPLSNTFFTTGSESWNYGATTAEAEGIVRAAQAQTAAFAYFGSEWKHFVVDVAAPTDVDSISETIERVLETIVRFGPQSIDLADLPDERLNGEHLAAVLRATYVWRDTIPGWQAAVQRANEALVRAGINPFDALIGLA